MTPALAWGIVIGLVILAAIVITAIELGDRTPPEDDEPIEHPPPRDAWDRWRHPDGFPDDGASLAPRSGEDANRFGGPR